MSRMTAVTAGKLTEEGACLCHAPEKDAAGMDPRFQGVTNLAHAALASLLFSMAKA